MAGRISLGPLHHYRLTVADVERSTRFYTDVLGFEMVLDGPPPAEDPEHELMTESLQGGVVLMNAGMIMGLRPVDDARKGDRFDPFRVGLDHLSFGADSRADLERTIAALDSIGVEHGQINDVQFYGLSFLAFKDPDGIQLELTAPLEEG